MSNTIALQLYTVRDEADKDFKGTVRKVAEIGYPAVEFAGYGNLSAKEQAALLAETGLRAVGTHVGLHALDNDLDGQINYCLEIGCPFMIVPWISEEWRTPEGTKRLGEHMNELGRRAKTHGITLGYHNHDFEFRQEDGGTFFDRFAAATDPEFVKLELDTFWAAFAGTDPIHFIKQYGERIGSLHLKDMTPDRKFTEVGDGTLDIAGYIKAGEEVGTRVYIVENDSPSIPSLESVRRSFENLHRSLT